MAIVDGLTNLDKTDCKIKAAETELSKAPGDIARAEAAVKNAEAKISTNKEKNTGAAKKIHGIEVDVKAVEEDMEKTKGHQRLAKSNKEYQIFKDKIEQDKAKIDKLEEDILVLMDGQEKDAKEAAAAKKELDEAQKIVAQVKKEWGERTKELEAELTILRAQRKEAAVKVDPEDLGIYERARRQARGKSALTPVRGMNCGGCDVRLPAQQLNLVFIGKTLVQCDSCARILYVDESSDTRKSEDKEK
jgi:predicted  nucleic acid-binding Zn-ribbon protein